MILVLEMSHIQTVRTGLVTETLVMCPKIRDVYNGLIRREKVVTDVT